MHGLEGVSGERASADAVCDVIVTPAVSGEKRDALFGEALPQSQVEAAVEVAAVAVKEQNGVDGSVLPVARRPKVGTGQRYALRSGYFDQVCQHI